MGRHPEASWPDPTERRQVWALDVRLPDQAPLVRLRRGERDLYRADCRAGNLICPLPDCDDRRLIARGGEFVHDHFAHGPGAGGHGPESVAHWAAKRMVGAWLRAQSGVSDVHVDDATIETGQQPDVSGRLPDGRLVVFEVQYAALSAEAWRERHERYERAGVLDTWLWGRPGRWRKLDKYIDFVLVPAVRDAAADAIEGRDSALRRLVDVLVRRGAAVDEPLASLRNTVAEGYTALMANPDLSLDPVAALVNKAIQGFAPGTSVVINWAEAPEVRMPDLQASARLVDDGVEGDVSSKGHGLQRAYIMAILQALAELGPAERGPDPGSDAEGEGLEKGLLLAIEEPELYQHPAQARRIARTLAELAGQGRRQVQVVACTHSPLFLDVRTFDDIRLVRKQRTTAVPRGCVTRATLDLVAARLELAHERVGQFSGAGLRPALVSLLNPYTAEAFFADFAVLVEGEEDKALLEASLREIETENDLPRWAVVVVPVRGKTNLDKMMAILTELGVPHYVAFDTEEGPKATADTERWNCVLQRLAGIEVPVAMPPTSVGVRVAMFAPNLTAVVQDEIGVEAWQLAQSEVCEALGIENRKDTRKNPEVVRDMLAAVRAKGLSSTSLDALATAVAAAVTSAMA